MSAEYSVKEVRAKADQCHVDGWPRLEIMLRDLAERIEADERAVPACWSLRHRDGTCALFADCMYDNEDDARNDAVALNGESGQLVPVPLFTHPPAQAAQVDRARETPRRQQAVETLLELGWQYNAERGWEEPAPTRPHSPDAADSGRVGDEVVERAEKAERERDFLVEEYERAVKCGKQGYLHAAMHLFNAITNASIDAAMQARVTTAPSAPEGGEVEVLARRLCAEWNDTQGVHCNRFPGWSELSEKERNEWRAKARVRQPTQRAEGE